MDRAAPRPARLPVVVLAAILSFAVLARGGYDLWAATTVYLAVLGLALALLWRSCWTGRGPGFAACLPLPLAGLIAAFALSFAQAVNPGESLQAALDWLAAIAAFWIAADLFAGEEEVSDFLAAMTLVILAELAVSVGQHIYGHELLYKAPGTLINANAATAFLIAWVPPLADRWRRADSPTARRLWGAALAIDLAGLLSFHSIWGALCLAVAVPFFAGPRGPWDWLRRRPRLLMAVGAAVAGLLLYKYTHPQDLYNTPAPAIRNVGRLLWWASGLQMFLDHPWLGVGLGNFGSAYVSYKVGTAQHSLFAHSLPVQLLAETGILGAGAFAAFLAAWERRLKGEAGKAPARWPFMLGAFLMLAYCLINVGLEYLANLLTLWIFLGIAAAGQPAQRWKPRRAVLLALAAGALASVPYLVSPLQASRLCVAAQERLDAGDWTAAQRGFAAAAGVFPLDSAAERGLAKALYGRFRSGGDPKDLDAAIAHQTRAVSLNRRISLLWRELGEYRSARGETAAARLLLEQAAALRPNPGS